MNRNRASLLLTPVYALVGLLACVLMAALGGCSNTGQTFGPTEANQHSATMPMVRIDDSAFNVANPTPHNVFSMNSGGLARTDVAASVFGGITTQAGASAFNLAQDAKGSGLSFKLEFDETGYVRSAEWKADTYDGSGSKAIEASLPIVNSWVGVLKAQSADQAAVTMKLIESIDPGLAALVKIVAMASGVPVP